MGRPTPAVLGGLGSDADAHRALVAGMSGAGPPVQRC